MTVPAGNGRGTPPLILASASPQRRRLLAAAGIRFRVVPSGVEEDNRGRDPRRLALRLALEKARAVARRFPNRWVLGADTLVVCRGRVIGKPRDSADAMRILRLLNGVWQSVITGVALVHAGDGKVLKGAAVSRVKARRMPEGWLRAFSRKHLDKAGAYSVQDAEDPFIERVVGPLDNVIGLPVDLVRRLLERSRR